MATVAAYVRVSTEAQADKDSPALQRDAIDRWLQQHPEYSTAQWYEDPGVSGGVRLAERPSGARLVADAEAGKIDAVVCYAYDRLHRDAADAIQVKTLLDDLGIPLFSIKEGALDDPFISSIRAVVAAEERRRIGQRSRDGSRTLAKEGRWLGGVTPYGYRVRPDTSGVRRSGWLEADTDLIPGLTVSPADVVRQIFDLAAEQGRSCVWIAEHLNAEAIPTRYAALDRNYVRGRRNQRVSNRWGPGAVRRILTNTTYKGEHYYGRRNTKAKGKRRRSPELVARPMPALVDAAAWDRAQATLKRNFIFNPRGAKRDYLLRGLLKCELCGRTYVGAFSEDAKGGPRYICGGRYKHLATMGTPCRAASIDWDIEAQVWSDLVSLFSREDVVAAAYAKHLKAQHGGAERAKRTLAKLTARQKGLDAEEQRLLTRFRKGGLSEGALDRQLRDIQTERASLVAQIEHAEQVAATVAATGAALDGAREFIAWVRQQVTRPELDFATRRRIVEALVVGGVVSTVVEPVRVKKRARAIPRPGYAVVRLAFRLGVRQQYRSGAPTRFLLPTADYLTELVRDAGAGLDDLQLADFDVDTGDCAMERALVAVTDSRRGRDSWPPPA